MNFGYSQQEWDYLIHHHEWEWPDGWSAKRDRIEQWRPLVERICAEEGLPVDERMEMVNASNVAFRVGDVVIKIFARRSPIWFPREVEALQALEDRPGAKSPRLVAHGQIAYGAEIHSYLVMERLPGESFRRMRESIEEEEQAAVMVELAAIARAIHETPIDRLTTFGKTPEEWVARMQGRAGTCMEYFADDLSPSLLEQLPRFLEENLPAITVEFRPRLLHADLIGGNILVAKEGGTWKITGLIDYGDVEVGPIEYEWVSACHKAMLGDPKLIRTFFEAYGWELPITDETRSRLRAYTILHRFTLLPFVAEEHPEIDSLEKLVDSMWPL
jgi:hygromycin-B 7''-O-kinase